MAKTKYAIAVDEIQAKIRPFLRRHGFRCRGRSFNRPTEDALTQVISIQMGPSDPPGTTYIPGLRENLHGLFAINLGVYVPEVAFAADNAKAKLWIQDYDCCIRTRLGVLIGGGKEVWWHARADERVISDVCEAFEDEGLTFLERFASRDRILAEWEGRTVDIGASTPPRIVSAIILVQRGELERSRKLLSLQALETWNPGHPKYVRSLAERLGLDALDA